MKQILLFGFLISLVISCTSENDGLLKSKYGDFISLDKTEMNIHIDENTFCSYQTFSAFKENNNEEALFAYNSSMHSLDIFNPNDKSVSHIQLESEGINGILNNVSGIHVHKRITPSIQTYTIST